MIDGLSRVSLGAEQMRRYRERRRRARTLRGPSANPGPLPQTPRPSTGDVGLDAQLAVKRDTAHNSSLDRKEEGR
jgi:hypothetical protein